MQQFCAVWFVEVACVAVRGRRGLHKCSELRQSGTQPERCLGALHVQSQSAVDTRGRPSLQTLGAFVGGLIPSLFVQLQLSVDTGEPRKHINVYEQHSGSD